MFSRAWITLLIATASMPCTATASLIFGAPPGGPVTVHEGSLDIDLNGDGVKDLTISVHGILSDGSVQGSNDWVFQASGVGVYFGLRPNGYAWPLNVGEQVGPSMGSNFLYSGLGLTAISVVPPNGQVTGGD